MAYISLILVSKFLFILIFPFSSNSRPILFKLRLNPSGDQKKCWNSKNTDMNEIISIISKAKSTLTNKQMSKKLDKVWK